MPTYLEITKQVAELREGARIAVAETGAAEELDRIGAGRLLTARVETEPVVPGAATDRTTADLAAAIRVVDEARRELDAEVERVVAARVAEKGGYPVYLQPRSIVAAGVLLLLVYIILLRSIGA